MPGFIDPISQRRLPVKLYHWPGTRSVRPRWLLEELGVPYEIERVNVFQGEGRTAAYLAIHPHGAVPALQIDGVDLFESGALCMFLADKYAEKGLAPPINTPERGLYYQWMFYVPATLEPPLFDIALHSTILPVHRRIPEVVRFSQRRFEPIARVLDQAVTGKTYLLGERFTAADILLAATLNWLPELIRNYPALEAYRLRLSQRPAYQRALE
jgi:glutathione S-transferase